MLRSNRSLLTVVALLFGCGEVTHALGDGHSELGAAGAETGGEDNGSGARGGSGSSPGVAVGDACLAAAPAPLAPPFAAPEVVWDRIHLFVTGEVLELATPPLPSEVTPEWAVEIALAAYDRAREQQPAPAGLRRFISKWLALDDEQEPAFDRDWAALAAADGATLETLLTFQDPAEPSRVGIFADSHWLTEHGTPGERGARINWALHPERVPAPPADIPTFETAPGMTRRESYESTVANPSCLACHRVFDPLGFALEHFDELGQYREVDAGKAVDTSGSLSLDEAAATFSGMVDLAPQLAQSCGVARTVSMNFLADAALASGVVQPASQRLIDVVLPYPDDVERIARAFISGDKTIRSLVAGAAQTETILR